MNLFRIFRKKERDVLSEYFKFFTKFYKIEKNQQLLGQGSFGTVFKVTNSVDDGEFALKIVRIERKDDGERRAAREIKCLRDLDHPNILRYYFAFKIDKLPTKWCLPEDFPSVTPLFCIQIELCNTNLREKLYEKSNQSDENLSLELNRFALQMCDAVKYFHRFQIMHRDLNPNNIFLKKDVYGILNVKIGDFGLGRFYNVTDDPLTIDQIGIQYYRCIEMNDNTEYTILCDVYSLGVILYEMFHPKLLVPSPESIDESMDESMDALRSVHKDVNIVKELSDDDTTSFSRRIKNLIIGMLQKEDSRPTAQKVVSMLSVALSL